MNKVKNILKLLNDYKIFFFDFETIGLNDPIPIEIGICDIDENEIINEIICSNRINEGMNINNIDYIKIRKGLNIDKIIEIIKNKCGKKCIFIGHNCKSIDFRIFAYELQNYINNWYLICTLDYAKLIDKEHDLKLTKNKKRKSFTLDSLKSYFGIKLPSHSAYADALACKRVFKKLLKIDTYKYDNVNDLNRLLINIKSLNNNFICRCYYDEYLANHFLDTYCLSSLDELKELIKTFIKNYCPKIKINADITQINRNLTTTYVTLKNDNNTINCSFLNSKFFKLPTINNKIVVEGILSVYNNSITLNAFDYYITGENNEKIKHDTIIEKFGAHINRQRKQLFGNYQKIGVVTSMFAKGFIDFINVAKCDDIILYDCKVQGTNAPETIIDAIKLANKHGYVDIISIIRGGGSNEDLNCFNDENLANAIIKSKIDIVTGIGHTSDNCLADLVAEKNFITPTECGKELTKDLLKNINDKKNIFLNLIKIKLNFILNKIKCYENNLFTLINKKYTLQKQIISDNMIKLKNIIKNILHETYNKILEKEKNIIRLINGKIKYDYDRIYKKKRQLLENIYYKKIFEKSFKLNEKLYSISRTLLKKL